MIPAPKIIAFGAFLSASVLAAAAADASEPQPVLHQGKTFYPLAAARGEAPAPPLPVQAQERRFLPLPMRPRARFMAMPSRETTAFPLASAARAEKPERPPGLSSASQKMTPEAAQQILSLFSAAE